MAIQKSITDVQGVTHASSYSKISAVTIESDRAHMLIDIYHNAAARSKDDASSRKMFVDQAWAIASGDDFTTYFADSALKAADKSPTIQAYAWLKTQTDALGQDWSSGTQDV